MSAALFRMRLCFFKLRLFFFLNFLHFLQEGAYSCENCPANTFSQRGSSKCQPCFQNIRLFIQNQAIFIQNQVILFQIEADLYSRKEHILVKTAQRIHLARGEQVNVHHVILLHNTPIVDQLSVLRRSPVLIMITSNITLPAMEKTWYVLGGKGEGQGGIALLMCMFFVAFQ